MSDQFDDLIGNLLAVEGGYTNDPSRTEVIASAINLALLARSAALAQDPIPRNFRSYTCSHPDCGRTGYAAGFCNAHYMRNRDGRDMDLPIKNRKRGTTCLKCDAPTNTKGGWGMCFKHYKRERLSTIKGAIVALFGGHCADCGESFHLAAYDFHHVGEKTSSVAKMMANASPMAIAEEVQRCVLLCANCHRIRHAHD